MRRADIVVRPDLAHGGERAALVLGVRIGVDEDDGDGLRARVDKLTRRGAHFAFIHRGADRAVGERALADLQPHVAVGDRDEVAPQPPGAAPVAAAHLQHVAETARCDDADLRAAPLQQRVGADRGAMHDRALRGAADRGEAVEEALRLVAAPRGHLRGRERARGRIEAEQVGERAADVDPDDHAHARAL